MGQSKQKKYWEFKNQNEDSADLYLYMDIAAWGYGYEAHSAKSFKAELDSLGSIKNLNMFVNSNGGDVTEGITIRNMLKRADCYITAYVDGLAASIASVILTAADKVVMYQDTMQMIHNPRGGTFGTSDELRRYADAIDKARDSIITDYLGRAGDKLDEETLKDMLEKETWLTAQECLNFGLCDEVITQNGTMTNKIDVVGLNDLGYRNLPRQFKNVLEAKIEGKKGQQESEEDKTARERQTALIAQVRKQIDYFIF